MNKAGNEKAWITSEEEKIKLKFTPKGKYRELKEFIVKILLNSLLIFKSNSQNHWLAKKKILKIDKGKKLEK